MGSLFRLLHRLPVCFSVNLLHQKLCLLRIQVVEYSKVFDELLDVGTEIGPAGGAGEDIAGAQIHEAVLAEGMAAGEDARDLLLVVVVVVADGASDFHFKNFY